MGPSAAGRAGDASRPYGSTRAGPVRAPSATRGWRPPFAGLAVHEGLRRPGSRAVDRGVEPPGGPSRAPGAGRGPRGRASMCTASAAPRLWRSRTPDRRLATPRGHRFGRGRPVLRGGGAPFGAGPQGKRGRTQEGIGVSKLHPSQLLPVPLTPGLDFGPLLLRALHSPTVAGTPRGGSTDLRPGVRHPTWGVGSDVRPPG